MENIQPNVNVTVSYPRVLFNTILFLFATAALFFFFCGMCQAQQPHHKKERREYNPLTDDTVFDHTYFGKDIVINETNETIIIGKYPKHVFIPEDSTVYIQRNFAYFHTQLGKCFLQFIIQQEKDKSICNHMKYEHIVYYYFTYITFDMDKFHPNSSAFSTNTIGGVNL